jgi:hypothetical protein
MDFAAVGKKIKEQYPQYKNVDDAVLGQQVVTKYGSDKAATLIGGQQKLENVAQGKPAEPSANDIKNKQAADASLGLINTLEQHYKEAGGAQGLVGGPGASLMGFLNLNPAAKTYSREKAGFAATLKKLTGDVGVLTDQDYARLSGLLAGLTDSPETAKNLFSDLRSQLASSFGGKATPTTYDPKQNKGDTGFGLTDKLEEAFGVHPLSSARNVAQDIGQTLGGKLTEKTDQATQQANQVANENFNKLAYQTKDPNKKRQYLQEILNSSIQNSQQQQDVQSKFSPDVSMNPILRGILAGTDVASAAEVPGLISGTKKFITNIPGAVKGGIGRVFTQGAGSALRNEAVDTATQAGKTISGDAIHNDIIKWGEKALKANPGENKQVIKILTEADQQFTGKTLTPKEVADIWSQVDSGFTNTGTTKTTVKAASDLALRDSLRKELEAVAPGWEKGTKQIAKGLRNKKIAIKGGAIAGGAAVSGVVGGLTNSIILNRILGKH